MLSGPLENPLLAAGFAEEMGHSFVLTLSMAIGVGAFLMVLAKRIQVPGIVLLIFGGVTLGPEGWNLVRPETLGDSLGVLVSMAVGVILFEGGLTLDLTGYRSAGRVIRRLLTLGVLITWVCTALAIWIFYRFNPLFCILAASLVIVTGPTVIQPLLKRLRLKRNLHHTLHWEGVLIDPIGVFAALLAFEWVVGGAGDTALLNLGLRIAGGLTIGLVGGELICFFLRRKVVPDDMLNGFMIGSGLMIFGITESVIAEGGLLSMTVAGLIIGARQPPELKEIVEFKSAIVELLIGFIFILLTAQLEFAQFANFGWKGFALVAVVMWVVRPIAIFACTAGCSMPLRERLFLSWIAPRGVVAASMASLFALALAPQDRFENPLFIESFVYSVIFVTVILQGLTALPLARLMHIQEPEAKGWLIVGAHPLGRAVARFVRDVRKVPVALIDGNRRAVAEAQDEGFIAIFADARESETLEDRHELQGVGRLLAFTDNEDLNELLCKKWEPAFGANHVYRWASTKSASGTATGVVLWSWMPKPSMLSSEIVLGEAALAVLEGVRLKTPGNLSALLTANSKEILLDPGPESQLKGDGKDPKTLYLQREADYLLNALNPAGIIRSHATEKEALFRELVEVIVRTRPEVAVESALEQILERENAAPTSLGKGIALPHAKIDGLSGSICAIAQVPDGIHFYNHTDEPVKIVFLLLSPPDNPEMHLAVLGEIARLMADSTVRRKLIECEDLQDMLGIIRRFRRQHTPFADARG